MTDPLPESADTPSKQETEIENKKWDTRHKIFSIISPVIIGIFSLFYTIPEATVRLRKICIENYAWRAEVVRQLHENDSLKINEVKIPKITDSVLPFGLSCLFGFDLSLIQALPDPAALLLDKTTPAALPPVAATTPAPCEPTSDRPTAGSDIETKESAPPTPSGWVAVGFLPNDSNFTLPKSLADLTVNNEITATTDVNVRNNAADWTTPRFVLRAGKKVKVLEVKTLHAGSEQQVWARVEEVEPSPKTQ